MVVTRDLGLMTLERQQVQDHHHEALAVRLRSSIGTLDSSTSKSRIIAPAPETRSSWDGFRTQIPSVDAAGLDNPFTPLGGNPCDVVEVCVVVQHRDAQLLGRSRHE